MCLSLSCQELPNANLRFTSLRWCRCTHVSWFAVSTSIVVSCRCWNEVSPQICFMLPLHVVAFCWVSNGLPMFALLHGFLIASFYRTPFFSKSTLKSWLGATTRRGIRKRTVFEVWVHVFLFERATIHSFHWVGFPKGNLAGIQFLHPSSEVSSTNVPLCSFHPSRRSESSSAGSRSCKP